MATITLEYDGRNIGLKKLIEAFVNLGGRVKEEDDTKMSEREFYSMLDKAKKGKVKRLTPAEQKKLFSV